MMGLWVTGVWEQTSRDGAVGHWRVGASRRHVMGYSRMAHSLENSEERKLYWQLTRPFRYL